jgi:Phage tail tube protein
MNKIDSNVTGLRYAEEESLKTLPTIPIWFPLEPNNYKDFGGQISTVARNPINPSRQRRKGVVTDVVASGGFNQDLTFDNTTRLLQGFFFADAREKANTTPMTGAAAVVITGVAATAKTYAAASGLGSFKIGALVLASGFDVAANNGVKTLTAVAADLLTVSETIADEASPPAAAKLETVGFKFPTADVSISLNGSLVRINSAATNLTTLGFVIGEWVFLGGDSVNSAFSNNMGWARISAIATGYLEFDKTSWAGQVEAGTGKTIQLFFGTVIKNEADPTLIKRRTYQVERSLGMDANGTMSEYLVGAVPNQLTINIAQADKVTIDLSFVACDNEQRTGTEGLKSGTRPALDSSDAFNTASDFSRIKLASVSSTDSAPISLFAFATEMTLTVNNNVTPDKAISVLGAFDTSAGTFEVGGSTTAYFASVDAVQAVRNNEDVTIDIVMVKKNKGLLFDVPLLSLGDGRLAVEQDKAIMLPLEINAAESKFQHTLLFMSFSYLPDLAG